MCGCVPRGTTRRSGIMILLFVDTWRCSNRHLLCFTLLPIRSISRLFSLVFSTPVRCDVPAKARPIVPTACDVVLNCCRGIVRVVIPFCCPLAGSVIAHDRQASALAFVVRQPHWQPIQKPRGRAHNHFRMSDMFMSDRPTANGMIITQYRRVIIPSLLNPSGDETVETGGVSRIPGVSISSCKV